MNESTQPLFRVGGVYRTQGGAVLKLANAVSVPHWGDERPGHKFAQSEAVLPTTAANGYECLPGDPTGYISLLDGRYVGAWKTAVAIYHLIPGELHQVNGEWVAKDSHEQMLDTFSLPEKKEEEVRAVTPLGGAVAKTPLQQLRDLVEIQGRNGTWNTDDYMVGLFNGLELALATMEGREPQFRSLRKPAVPIGAALTRMSGSTHLFGSSWAK